MPIDIMEKIFQIPFHLRPMRTSGFAQLIDALTTPKEQDNDSELYDRPTSHSEGNYAPIDASSAPRQSETSLQEPVELNPQYLQIEDEERDFIKQLHHFIPSPREAKRFVNIYRLLKASVENDRLPIFLSKKWYQNVLLLLAMLIGYPMETTEILHALQTGERHTEKWWTFIDSFQSRGDFFASSLESTRPEIAIRLETTNWSHLLAKLAEVRSLMNDGRSCRNFIHWAPQVVRYSYYFQSTLLT